MEMFGRLSMESVLMEICWALTKTFEPTETLTPDVLKQAGPLWGPYEIWPKVWNDNVVTNDFDVARQLLSNQFDQHCNLWSNDDFYVKLQRPQGLNTYTWSVSAEIENKEELLGLQLASTRYDIILCAGWDLHTTAIYKPSTIEKHLRQNYLNYLTAVVKAAPCQFVFVDPQGDDVHPGLTDLDNFSIDTAKNTLELLKQL